MGEWKKIVEYSLFLKNMDNGHVMINKAKFVKKDRRGESYGKIKEMRRMLVKIVLVDSGTYITKLI